MICDQQKLEIRTFLEFFCVEYTDGARRRKWYGSVQLQIFKGIVPCLIRFTKILEK